MAATERHWKTDCRFFEGDRPCVHRRECEGCDLYSPAGKRVLVLKIGALGDVLRTTPILEALSRHFGEPFHVSWVAGEAAAPLLRANPRIDRLLVPSHETSELLGVERFDLLLSLDKDPYSTALATRLEAVEKRGFGRDEQGALVPIHPAARYAYDLGLSDDLKFHHNTKTYQEIVFEICGFEWRGEEYDVPAAAAPTETGAALEAFGVPASGGPLVGMNTGAGGVFANKAWTLEGYAELSRRLAGEGCRVALLGGRAESKRNARIAELSGGAAVETGTDFDLCEFAGLVAGCDLVVSGDTLGMHLAIAARVPVVVLFGSTCAQEIELYGRGEKIVTPISCHPCYRRECDISPSCQDLISVETVHAAVQRTLASLER